MATGQGPQATRPPRRGSRPTGVNQVSSGQANREDPTRELRPPVKDKKSLEHYRKSHPLPPSKNANGLLAIGTLREVEAGDMDHPASVECFTLPEAAKALGRSELTLKKWIADDMIPEPVLRDTVRGYRHYSVGELRIMSRMLAEHERDNAYYTRSSTQTRERLMQAVHAYRMQYI